uniref:Uncharacterized protein n=1 Tax=Brassica oleracea TaxID=3712 RepID=A0A3P6AYQ0_BRAOL|nr:unnamed protein product [Brassica oleracea]
MVILRSVVSEKSTSNLVFRRQLAPRDWNSLMIMNVSSVSTSLVVITDLRTTLRS